MALSSFPDPMVEVFAAKLDEAQAALHEIASCKMQPFETLDAVAWRQQAIAQKAYASIWPVLPSPVEADFSAGGWIA